MASEGPGALRSQPGALGILGWANPLDFGVRGDGIVDDSVYMDRLFAGLVARQGGGTVVLAPTPAGYRLSQAVSVPAGLTVIVSGGVRFVDQGLDNSAGGVIVDLENLGGGGPGTSGSPGIVVRVNPTDLPINGGGGETVALPFTVQQDLGDHGITINNNNLVLASQSLYDVTLYAIATNTSGAVFSGTMYVRLYIDGGSGGIGSATQTFWQSRGTLQSNLPVDYRIAYQDNYVRISSAAAEALTLRVLPSATVGANGTLNLAQLLITRRSSVPTP